MTKPIPLAAMLVAGTCCGAAIADAASRPAKKPAGIDSIETVVVIYAENRSFDHLYGFFPGANGLQRTGAMSPQVDRDDSVMKELPPIWGGLTAMGHLPVNRRNSASRQCTFRNR